MSILSRFAKNKAACGVDAVAEAPECSHWEVAPWWSSAEDIGNEDKVVSYACTGCGASLTPAEVGVASRSLEESSRVRPLEVLIDSLYSRSSGQKLVTWPVQST